MSEWALFLLLAVGAFFYWQHKRNSERSVIANERLDRDTQLFRAIKSAKREYEFYTRDQPYKFHEDGELVYETPHYAVYNVRHFAESRLSFYFRDTEEYGLYGFFAGNPGEYFDSYYRTDNTFQKEQSLIHRDD